MLTRDAINPTVRGVYDLQALRLQSGLRLAANFRAKLKRHADDAAPPEMATGDAELSPEAESILDQLRSSYKSLTAGIARNRQLPDREGFVGDPLISSYAELILIHQFVVLEREEAAQFRLLGDLLEEIPIYAWLKGQRGVGPALAGALISRLDPHRARHISSFWKYCGLDVAADGRGRSRREEHLVERTYINKAGKEAVRRGITYDPWLKSKLFVLAASFLRAKSPWADVYRQYRHRLETDPQRIKLTVTAWKKRHAAGDDTTHLWPPGRIDMAAKRYTIKQFLAALWIEWRRLEGLPVTESYHSAVLGHDHAAE
jgi:hypothetical protein